MVLAIEWPPKFWWEPSGVPKDVEPSFPSEIDPKKPPAYASTFTLKDPSFDELLPLFIILAHRRPEVQSFYQNLFKFLIDFHKGGQTTWVGQWMNNKLLCKIMERFGLLELGGSASYDAGLSWAFGTVAATEFLSDIQVGSLTEGDVTTKWASLGKIPITPKKKEKKKKT